jgi:hypothetical protein
MEHLAIKADDGLVPLLHCFGGGNTKHNPNSNNKKIRRRQQQKQHNTENDLIQISFNNKTHHFRRLHQLTGIPYEEMVFFDNEYWNIESVSKLGVKCIYTPDGMMKHHWDEAKQTFGIIDD